MSQGNLFGPPDDDPVDYEKNCDELWRKWSDGHHFSADDITAKVGLPPGDHNKLGQIIRDWHGRGMIEWTDQTVTSTRRDRHSGTQRIWRKRRRS